MNKISVIVFARDEELLLYKSLRSAYANIEVLRNAGIEDVDFAIYLTDPTPETIRVAHEFCVEHDSLRIIELAGATAQVRNAAVSECDSEFIACLNATDLLSQNFLLEALDLATSQESSTRAVYCTEFVVEFGAENVIRSRNLIDQRVVIDSSIVVHDPCIGAIFASKDIYVSVPFQQSLSPSTISWQWNCSVVAHGMGFISVPRTIYFKRTSSNQIDLKQFLLKSSVLAPSHFSALRRTNIGDTNIDIADSRTKRSSIPLNMSKALKRHISPNSATYRYVHGQYHLNRNYISSVKNVLLGRTNKQYVLPEIEVATSWIGAIGVSEAHIVEWAEMNDIEPMIRPTPDVLRSILIESNGSTSSLGLSYYNMCSKYKDSNFTDLVLVPHIIRGGADLAAIHLIKALSQDKHRKVLVLTTLDVDSPWRDHVESLANVKFDELRNFTNGLSYDDQKLLVFYILQNWGIGALTIINAQLGYDVAREYKKVLGQGCLIYLHTYAFDMTQEGFKYNVIQNGLVDTYPFVDLFITDCLGYKKQLMQINGFSNEKVQELYLPVEKQNIIHSNNEIHKKVLWASRVSSAKLIEVAVEIGAALACRGIELHFFGALDHEYEEGGVFQKMISPYPNIHYHGKYDGFSSIDTSQYDLFLLTSKNEGMPNVVLEAAMSNMFIIAPHVGGIPEVISDGINGYLVTDNFTSQEYIDDINRFYDEGQKNMDARLKLNREIADRHSWKTYKINVKSIYAKPK